MFSYQKYVGEIEKNLENFISLLVQNINVQVTDKLTSLEQLAVKVYEDHSLIEGLMVNEQESVKNIGHTSNKYINNSHEIGQKLSEVAKFNRYIANLQIITPHDQYVMRNEYGARNGGYIRNPEQFRKSKYYQEAIAQHGYPVWFDTTNETTLFYKREASDYGMTNTITMTQAIYELETHQLLGVLVINVDINFLTDSLKSYSFYGSGNTFIFSKYGGIIGINANLSAPNMSHLHNTAPIKNMDKEGSYTGKVNGINLFLVYKTVPYTEFSIVHVVDKDQLLHSAYSIRNLCLTIVAFLIVLSFIILYWTTISISWPLNNLMRAMKAFTKNEFNVNYKVSGHDEITVLSHKFNEMVENTKILIDQIYIAEIKQKTLELHKTNAELNALQMQINPHFLYNTLDIIRWETMYEAGGESKASYMIEDFCRLMRMSIKSDEDLTTIQHELQHAEIYLQVVNFRHRDKIQLNIQFPLDMSLYMIPKLTLQPLLENAILHGFDEATVNAVITLSGDIDQDDLIIHITDNGKGMEPEQLQQLQMMLSGQHSSSKSIALKNVNQRLKLYFGEAYGISLYSRPNMGTTIVFRLPIQVPVQDHATSKINKG